MDDHFLDFGPFTLTQDDLLWTRFNFYECKKGPQIESFCKTEWSLVYTTKIQSIWSSNIILRFILETKRYSWPYRFITNERSVYIQTGPYTSKERILFSRWFALYVSMSKRAFICTFENPKWTFLNEYLIKISRTSKMFYIWVLSVFEEKMFYMVFHHGIIKI